MYNRLTFIWYNKTIKDLLLRKVISGSEKILIYFIYVNMHFLQTVLQCVYVLHGIFGSLFQYFQILMLIESLTHMNKTLWSFLNSHSLQIWALICAACKCIPGPFPSIFRDFCCCCCFLFCDCDTRTQLEFKSSPWKGKHCSWCQRLSIPNFQ